MTALLKLMQTVMHFLILMLTMSTAVTCSSLTALTNGDISYAADTSAPFDFETIATYRCNNGFGLSGGDRVRTCMLSPLGGGFWSGVAPACNGKRYNFITHSDSILGSCQWC